jgi:hypothetical protein
MPCKFTVVHIVPMSESVTCVCTLALDSLYMKGVVFFQCKRRDFQCETRPAQNDDVTKILYIKPWTPSLDSGAGMSYFNGSLTSPVPCFHSGEEQHMMNLLRTQVLKL